MLLNPVERIAAIGAGSVGGSVVGFAVADFYYHNVGKRLWGDAWDPSSYVPITIWGASAGCILGGMCGAVV